MVIWITWLDEFQPFSTVIWITWLDEFQPFSTVICITWLDEFQPFSMVFWINVMEHSAQCSGLMQWDYTARCLRLLWMKLNAKSVNKLFIQAKSIFKHRIMGMPFLISLDLAIF